MKRRTLLAGRGALAGAVIELENPWLSERFRAMPARCFVAPRGA